MGSPWVLAQPQLTVLRSPWGLAPKVLCPTWSGCDPPVHAGKPRPREAELSWDLSVLRGGLSAPAAPSPTGPREKAGCALRSQASPTKQRGCPPSPRRWRLTGAVTCAWVPPAAPGLAYQALGTWGDSWWRPGSWVGFLCHEGKLWGSKARLSAPSPGPGLASHTTVPLSRQGTLMPHTLLELPLQHKH